MAETLLIVGLLIFAAVTAASETATIAASRLKLRKLARDGSKTAKTVLKILETPERFFGAILVANNTVDSLIASIMTVIMIAVLKDGNKGVIVATILATVFIIIFEVCAKTLAAKHPEKLSLILVRPLQGLIFVLSPIVNVFAAITNFILTLIGADVKGKKSLISEEEIRSLIKIGEEEGTIHKEKYKMLSKVFDFSDAVAKNVMTPKKDMVTINVSSDLNDILNRVLESGYSRLPVYKDNPDNIIGVINMKDLLSLMHNKELLVLQDIIYPPTFVPGSKKVTELLKDFQKGHTHIAVVNDVHGKPEGIITLEDLLEEIVGEIEDEYDIRLPHEKL